MANERSILAEGASRVWRYQRVLWWYFFVNLVLARFASLSLKSRLGAIADHSLEARRLTDGFDVGTFMNLVTHPDAPAGATFHSFFATFVFFVFSLLLTGGILEAYRVSHKLSTADFFQACGNFFWRWLRLLLFMILVLVPVGFLCYGLSDRSIDLMGDAPREKTGYWALLASIVLTLLLAMVIRLWFDMAQVRAVAEDERAMRKTFIRSFKLTFTNFFSLFSRYFFISLLAWLGLALGIWFWAHNPPQHFGITFLILELTLLWWAGTRLWQRATETVWYERRALLPVPIPIAPVPPAPPAEPNQVLPELDV